MDMSKRMVLGGMLGLLVGPVGAANPASPAKQDAIDLVNKALAHYKAHGKEATLGVLNQKVSDFVRGELYVFAYDLSGNVIAHPLNPRLVGKNMLEIPDQEGKFYRKDVQRLAVTQGTGWVDYLYKNPETNKIERKSAYLQKADDMIFVCGIYVGAW